MFGKSNGLGGLTCNRGWITAASATLLALAPVLSVGIFAKTWVGGDDKQDCCEQVPICGNFHATFSTTDAMLSCRTGSQSINTTRRNVVLPWMCLEPRLQRSGANTLRLYYIATSTELFGNHLSTNSHIHMAKVIYRWHNSIKCIVFLISFNSSGSQLNFSL